MIDFFLLICLSFRNPANSLKFNSLSAKHMKTPHWFTRNRAFLRLRIATAVTLIFAAAAMVFFAAHPSSVVAQSTGAEVFLKPKPLPPKKNSTALAATAAPVAGSPWQLLNNQPPVLDYTDCGPGNPILLTDGTVMLADNGCQDWWELTPDGVGSYVNGTVTQLAALPGGYSPLYHSSAVLPDGRVIIEGGEYNFLNPAWTDKGAIYDPLANTWTLVAPPPLFGGFGPFPRTIGDAQSVVLFDGTFMQANCCTDQAALLNT